VLGITGALAGAWLVAISRERGDPHMNAFTAGARSLVVP
jgi:hypothetical protein